MTERQNLDRLLAAVGGIDLTEAEHRALAWLAGWETHVVNTIAELLDRAREGTGRCQHRDKAPAGRLSGPIADADTALAGLHVETVIGTCTGCGELVAETELRRSRNAPPLWVSPPVVLRRQQRTEGWSL